MSLLPRYSLTSLQIVAYADPPPEYLLPSIVAPIFRMRESPHDLLLPPYELAGEELVGGVRDAEGALRRMVWLGAAALISEPLEPRADHVLWLDQGYSCAYEPRSVVLRTLRDRAAAGIAAAREALRNRRFEDALNLAQTALAADENSYEAIIIKAAVYVAQDKQDFVNELKLLAEAVDCGRNFDREVQTLGWLIPDSTACSLSRVGIWERDVHRLWRVFIDAGFPNSHPSHTSGAPT